MKKLILITVLAVCSFAEYGKITVAIDPTYFADTSNNFLYVFNLHNIKSDVFWNNINSTGSSIGLFDSAGTTAIKRQIGGFNKTTKQGLIKWSMPASPNIYKYITIDYSDTAVTFVNDSTAIRDAGIVSNPDFGDAVLDGKLEDNAKYVSLDTIMGAVGFVQDTCQYGYYLKATTGQNIRPKIGNAVLNLDTGSYTAIVRFDSLSETNFPQIFMLYNNAQNYTSLRQNNSNDSTVAVVICTTNVQRSLGSAQMVVDATWHIITCGWSSSNAYLAIDSDTMYNMAGNRSLYLTDTSKYSLFGSLSGASSSRFKGAIAQLYLYNTVKTPEEISAIHNMLMDNALMYEFEEPAPILDSLIPASTFIKGSLVLSSGKTAKINGTTATVSSQTDSTAIVVGRLRNGLQDTISLTAGMVSDSVKVNSKVKGNKITWKTK